MTIAFKCVHISSSKNSTIASDHFDSTDNREKMKIPANVVDQLVQGAQSDIRQVVNMLSTWKLNKDSMDFDEGKDLLVIHSIAVWIGCSFSDAHPVLVEQKQTRSTAS